MMVKQKVEMRYIIIAILITLIILFISVLILIPKSFALDNPHNIYSTTNCANCHQANPPANWWTDQGGGTSTSPMWRLCKLRFMS